MTQPSFVIRLDIDTMVCAKSITDLLHLADKLNCRFSFFVNVGKSVSIPAAIQRRLTSKATNIVKETNPAKKLSIRQKIGMKGIIETIVFNKKLLPLCKNELLKAKSYGHEVGLHGGMNHGIWQSFAPSMTDDEISMLLTPAMHSFIETFGEDYGFTSPGFAINPHSYELLANNSCKYISDHVDSNGIITINPKVKLPNIPVTLAAKENVDFLESYIASNNTTPLDVIAKNSIGKSNFSVTYSHPCLINNIGNKIFCQFIKEMQQIANNKLLMELL